MAARGIGTALGLALAATLSATSGIPAVAAEEVTALKLHYDVYSSGFSTVDFDVFVQETKASYRVDFNAHTVGIADWLFGFKVQSMSQGQVTPTGTAPTLYSSSSVAHSKERFTRLLYTGGRVEAELKPPVDDEDVELTPVTPEMQVGTSDPLAAILGVARGVASGERCNRRVAVFDGRRRYDLIFQEVGTEPVEPSSRNIFSGTARRCHMQLNRIGGYPVDASTRITGNEGTIWFASVLPNTPPVPVQIVFEGRLGTSYVHLAEAAHGSDIRKASN
jgi:hypothetical protein